MSIPVKSDGLYPLSHWARCIMPPLFYYESKLNTPHPCYLSICVANPVIEACRQGEDELVNAWKICWSKSGVLLSGGGLDQCCYLLHCGPGAGTAVGFFRWPGAGHKGALGGTDVVWLSPLVVLAEVFPWTQMGQHPSKPGAVGAAWWLMAIIPRTLSSSEQKPWSWTSQK